ncbi:UDP-N-acetylglucosamine 2-epimerase [Guggenheimella bovis]
MKLACATGSRAEYFLLRPLLLELKKHHDLTLYVTGTHLSKAHGYTADEIEFPFIEIPILDESGSVSKAMSRSLLGFDEAFKKDRPDHFVVLGDRYEIFEAVVAAHLNRIPISHIHGGEVTEGALDDAYRHSITKFSSLHFVSTESHRKRVIQLGEHPDRVFNVGALGVQNILETELLSKEEVLKDLNLRENYILSTYHPVTLQGSDELDELLKALEAFDCDVLFTGANADPRGDDINKVLREKSETDPRIHFVPSLGLKRYLSAAKHALAVVGNSSSGVIEIPSLKVPSVDIGNRQRGRERAESVLHAECKSESIQRAIHEALEYKGDYTNPYEGEDPKRFIARIIEEKASAIDLMKGFYDL